MKRSIFLSIICLLCAVSAMAADKLVVSDVSVVQGKESVLDIGCQMQTACKAFQMDVELGSGFTLKLDAAGKPKAELGTTTDHKVYSRHVSNGKYRFVVISMNGKQLPKSGTLLKLTLVAPSTAQAGSSITGSVKAIEFATAQTKPLVLSNATFKVTIASKPPKGDVNGDNTIDVADIATIISVMAGSADASSALADVNEDGIVDVADIATVIDIMAGGGGNKPDPDSEPAYTSCPDDNHPHAIDLGLPSGTKWACCNVGATKPKGYPEEIGNFYAWGETEKKYIYSWETYLYGNSETDLTNIGSDISSTKYDVAHVIWSGSWHMPTKEQFEELYNSCTLKSTGGGYKFIGNNGNVIYLPRAGRCLTPPSGFPVFLDHVGCYWSSTLDSSNPSKAYVLVFSILSMNDKLIVDESALRYYGNSVRPVQ